MPTSRFNDMFRVEPPDEPDDVAPEEPETAPWWGPPRDELGVALSENVVVGRSEHAVVALTHVVVYSTGASFDFVAVARGLKQSELDRLMLGQNVWGRGELVDTFIRFGVELADGRRASNVEWVHGQRRLWEARNAGEEPDAPVLWHHGGGNGSGSRSRITLRPGFWLWPVPPPGPLLLFCEWPAAGIALTTSEIDATTLTQAARRVEPLWPHG